MEAQLIQANRIIPWPLIVVPLVSFGMIALGLITASLDKPVMPVENAESGAEILFSLMMRWYC
jgi:hypothetical protein